MEEEKSPLPRLNAQAWFLAEDIAKERAADTKSCEALRRKVADLHERYESLAGVVVPDEYFEGRREHAVTANRLARSYSVMERFPQTLKVLQKLELAIRPCRTLLWQEKDAENAERLGSGSSLFELNARWACIRSRETQDKLCDTVAKSRVRFAQLVREIGKERDRLRGHPENNAKTEAGLLTLAIANVVAYGYGEDDFDMIGFLGGVYNGLCNCACGSVLYLAIAEALYGVPEYLNLYRFADSHGHTSLVCADALAKKCVLQTYETTDLKAYIATPNLTLHENDPSLQVIGRSHGDIRFYVAWLHTLPYSGIRNESTMINELNREFGSDMVRPEEQLETVQERRKIRRHKMKGLRDKVREDVHGWTLPDLRKRAARVATKKERNQVSEAIRLDTELFLVGFSIEVRQGITQFILSPEHPRRSDMMTVTLYSLFGEQLTPPTPEKETRLLHALETLKENRVPAVWLAPRMVKAVHDAAETVQTEDELVQFMDMLGLDEMLRVNGLSVDVRNAVASYFAARLSGPEEYELHAKIRDVLAHSQSTIFRSYHIMKLLSAAEEKMEM